MAEPLSTPAGYMRDARGRLVPIDLIKPIDLLRHELVSNLIASALEMASSLALFRGSCEIEIDSFLHLSAMEYDLHLGGQRGNLSLISFDGLLKVQRQIQDRITFDERLQHAKMMIDQCLDAWSEGADNKIRLIVQDAFQVDKEGAINRERVLGLRRIDIDDPKWLDAMRALNDSIQTESSKAYLRFYQRSSTEDGWSPIQLDISKVGVQ